MNINNFKQQIQNDNTITDKTKDHYTKKVELLVRKEIPIDDSQEQIIKKLKEIYPKQSTYKSMIYPVIKYRTIINLPIDLLKKEYVSITKAYTEKQEEQQTEKELISLDNLKKLKTKIPSTDSQFKLVFSLYTEHPPVRNDFFDLKYKNYDTENDNYYDKKNKTIILNRFKTAKYYDTIEIPLLKNEITLINRIVKDSPDEYVFKPTRGGVFDTKKFTEYLQAKFKKYTGLELGSSDLRKIYVSANSDKSLKERKVISKSMGHSPYEAELHYKKLNIN